MLWEGGILTDSMLGYNMFAYCGNNPVNMCDCGGDCPHNGNVVEVYSKNCLFCNPNTHMHEELFSNMLKFSIIGRSQQKDLGGGWTARIYPENSSTGTKRHIHVEKNGKKYSQNEDGSPHDGSSGKPDKKVIIALKNKMNWDWNKKEQSYKFSINPSILHLYNCGMETGNCTCGILHTFSISGYIPIFGGENYAIPTPVPYCSPKFVFS